MSGIARRTIFQDPKSLRYSGWALVNTAVGSMAEPFYPGLVHVPSQALTNIAMDEINKVDESRFFDSDKTPFSTGPRPLIGGNWIGNTGR